MEESRSRNIISIMFRKQAKLATSGNQFSELTGRSGEEISKFLNANAVQDLKKRT